MFNMINNIFVFLLRFNLFRKIQEKQFLPTKGDIDNKEVKKLANRLKGKNDSETLNNILEWQDRNLSYWPERAIMEIPTIILFPLFMVILGVVSIVPLIIIHFLLTNIISNFFSLVLLLLLIIILGIILYKQPMIMKLLYIITFSFPLYKLLRLYLTKFYNNNPALVKQLLDLSIVNWSIFGISLFILFYLFFSYFPYFREKGFLSKIKEIIKLINLQFKNSLSINEILKYRLAICRDYAKLTSVLLSKLYPKNNIYFVTFWGHVAVAIEFNNRLYIVDQKMPITSSETWLKRWNKNKAALLKIKINKDIIKTEFYKIIKTKEDITLNKFLDKLIRLLEIKNKKKH